MELISLVAQFSQLFDQGVRLLGGDGQLAAHLFPAVLDIPNVGLADDGVALERRHLHGVFARTIQEAVGHVLVQRDRFFVEALLIEVVGREQRIRNDEGVPHRPLLPLSELPIIS